MGPPWAGWTGPVWQRRAACDAALAAHTRGDRCLWVVAGTCRRKVPSVLAVVLPLPSREDTFRFFDPARSLSRPLLTERAKRAGQERGK